MQNYLELRKMTYFVYMFFGTEKCRGNTKEMKIEVQDWLSMINPYTDCRVLG